MPTNFQENNFIQYALTAKKEQQQQECQQQQDGSRIIIILNKKLQDQRQHIIPPTRKKRRYNPPPSSSSGAGAGGHWKNYKCKTPQRKHGLLDIASKDTRLTFSNLLTELEFSCDCLATIDVIYTSLRHTYRNSRGSIIEQQGNGTRLCDMEKELLIAYDDLYLQVNHLEKNVIRMEQALMQLKSV